MAEDPTDPLVQALQEPEALRAARSDLEAARADVVRLLAARDDTSDASREACRAAQDRYGLAAHRLADLEGLWRMRLLTGEPSA